MDKCQEASEISDSLPVIAFHFCTKLVPPGGSFLNNSQIPGKNIEGIDQTVVIYCPAIIMICLPGIRFYGPLCPDPGIVDSPIPPMQSPGGSGDTPPGSGPALHPSSAAFFR